jgi:hypothetical protein
MSSSFCFSYFGYFGGRVSRNICLGWPQISILQISASQIAEITGMSHWHPDIFITLKRFFFLKQSSAGAGTQGFSHVRHAHYHCVIPHILLF